jgi:hypothetical protein
LSEISTVETLAPPWRWLNPDGAVQVPPSPFWSSPMKNSSRSTSAVVTLTSGVVVLLVLPPSAALVGESHGLPAATQPV